jgi:hypothetical protein
MEPKNPQTESATIDQLQKYADDLNQTIVELKTGNQELQESYLDTIH